MSQSQSHPLILHNDPTDDLHAALSHLVFKNDDPEEWVAKAHQAIQGGAFFHHEGYRNSLIHMWALAAAKSPAHAKELQSMGPILIANARLADRNLAIETLLRQSPSKNQVEALVVMLHQSGARPAETVWRVAGPDEKDPAMRDPVLAQRLHWLDELGAPVEYGRTQNEALLGILARGNVKSLEAFVSIFAKHQQKLDGVDENPMVWLYGTQKSLKKNQDKKRALFQDMALTLAHSGLVDAPSYLVDLWRDAQGKLWLEEALAQGQHNWINRETPSSTPSPSRPRSRL